MNAGDIMVFLFGETDLVVPADLFLKYESE